MVRTDGEPRVVDAVKRGWHVLRDDGTWGLVAGVQSDDRNIYLCYEDDLNYAALHRRGGYVMTRDVVQQMAHAIRERDERSTWIRGEQRRRAAQRLLAATAQRAA